ncbi:hypothetical protein KUTeg_000209 [Tegillarca granosa]|uniref:Uncharacterized protein n=1 Tax=Tegillarca granosa TaxID=220873 RepID=A0ABQ9FWW4_TEGGR|nr:hypothetical protein KUTeg_000209 [Tegillarca granosa]
MEHPAVHGVWSSWTSWGTCTVTCGGGTHTRSRLCNNPAPQYGGDNCTGADNGIQDCNTHNCPKKSLQIFHFIHILYVLLLDVILQVDGFWASWAAWSACSVTCAGGTQSKTRTCSNPAPQYGGAYCSGASIAGQTCNTHNCPIDGGWTSWTSWTSCPVTCGGGTQTRSRSCTNPAPQYQGANCQGLDASSQSCNTQNCPSKLYFIRKVTKYVMYNDMEKYMQIVPNFQGIVDGEWTSWTSWDTCTVTCGGGTQGRTRTCTNPAPQYGGADCAVDGAWAQWSPWGSCSVTCGGGTYSRSRTCSDPAPANGGLNCTGDSANYGDCNTTPCPTVAAGSYLQNDCDDGSDETEGYGQCPAFMLAACKSHAGTVYFC